MTLANPALRGGWLAFAAPLVAIACAGCASPGDVQREDSVVSAQPQAARTRNGSLSRAQIELRRGIRSYEDAEYESAARSFRSALDRGLKAPGDKAKAYKYLAFIACTSGKMKSCNVEFRNALQADPKFELAPAEAGHPIWGPAFRNARLEVSGKARSR
jgi:hypothetical protein